MLACFDCQTRERLKHCRRAIPPAGKRIAQQHPIFREERQRQNHGFIALVSQFTRSALVSMVGSKKMPHAHSTATAIVRLQRRPR